MTPLKSATSALISGIFILLSFPALTQPTLEWARGFGSSGLGYSFSVTTDPAGNVYTAGFFSGTSDFDPGAAVVNLTSSGGYDIYISKMNSSGNLVWAMRMGGPTNDVAHKIALDNLGNIYTTGVFTGTADFDPGTPNFPLTAAAGGGNDVFISKLDNNGNFVWAGRMGGTNLSGDFANGLAVDASGNVYVGGYFYGTNVDYNPHPTNTSLLSSAGNAEIFIVKLATDMGFIWARKMGGTSIDLLSDLTVDAAGNVYSTGFFTGTNVDFDPGVATNFPLNAVGSQDVFFSKLDTDGNFLLAKGMGGTGDDYGSAITRDGLGNVLISGFYENTADFDPGTGNFPITSVGQRDAFVSKLDAAGDFVWARSVGGPDSEGGNDLSTDPAGNVFVTGAFSGTADFDPGAGTFPLTSASLSPSDIYLLKLTTTGNFGWAVRMGGLNSDVGISIAVDPSNVLYSTGYFQGTADFDPGPGTFNLTSASTYSTFVQKSTTNPKIYSFTPTSGPVGTSVTITGANFSTTPGNNIVFFGATRAAVTGATATQLTVTVPIGATYHNITATIGGLTTYSRHPFNVTFALGGLIGACSFAPKVDFTPGARPADIAFGDLDGDGKADVATINDQANNLSVFRNTSTSGSVSLDAPINLASGSSPQSMEIGDMDGDGKLDLVAVSDGSARVQVYRNIGTGSIAFDPFVGFTTGSTPVCVAIGDIDGDGKMDIAVANSGSSTVSIFRNTGSAGTISFAAKIDFAVGTSPMGIAIGDIDGDDKPEVLSGNRTASTISVFRNTSTAGNISLQPRIDLTTGASSGTNGVAVADLDGDGKSDIVTANRTNRTVSVFRNISVTGTITAGSFNTRVDLSNGAVNNPMYVSVGDVSGDHKPDLIISNDNGTIVQVHRNTSSSGAITSSSFAAKVDFTTGTRPHNVISGDLDGDGAPELASSNGTSNTISILRNIITSSPAPTFTSFIPTTGPIGTPVTITGTNFSPIPANNTVYFNGVASVVTTSSATSIETTVPVGATSGMITVAVGCNSVIRPEPFILTGPCIPAAERSALIALYMATNGAGWSNNSNWLSADESTWFGVTVTGCHVTAIELEGNNLTGSIPPEIGNLIELTELDLTGNQLTGDLPIEIANLDKLQSLYLQFNSLTGPLPDDIGNMTALRELVTQQNAMSGTIPASLENCTSLEELSLDRNQHTGDIPAFLGSMTTLRRINLSINQFDGVIPPELGNLSDLTDLLLADNQLFGEIPPELGALSNLLFLDLSRNQLFGQIPVELGDLSSLGNLQLWSNFLSGAIPPELGNLPSLIELNLSQNQLDGSIPGDLGNLTNLRVLRLGNNLLSGAVPFELGTMPSLETVSLVHNSFTSIPTFTSTSIVELFVEENFFDFGDLEPNAGVANYTYDPQALLPPGGVIQFIVGGTVLIPFATAGTANSYQWFKDGSAIPGATSDAYLKGGAVVGDVGLYAVRVTNSIVPNVALISEVFTVITDPCTGVPRISGQLDASFDSHLRDPAGPKELGLQSTGKIIASLSSNFITPVEVEGISRFNTDGSLDNTFNSSVDQPDEGQLLVQSDDKIVYFYASEIHRLNADGTDDGAFNANAPNYYNSTVYALAQQPDGKILIAVSEDGNLYVDRINTDGTNDATFTGPTDLEVSVIRVQSDGKILLGGYFFGGIMRLNADGSDDAPFNENGADEGILDIAIQPDGKIIAIGLFSYFNSIPRRGIVRLNSDGSIDDGFTAIGITDNIESYNHATRVVLQPDGKIVLAGFFETVNGADRKNLVRLNSDGTVDCPFSPGLSTDEIIDNMIIQSDGKILIAGDFVSYDGTTRNGFARVNTGGGPTIVITQQPADASVCIGTNGTFTTSASGAVNITYRWQFSATGTAGTFADISDGPNYAGTATNALTVITTGSFGAGRYRCRINGDAAAEVFTNNQGLIIGTIPAAPTTTAGTSCGPSNTVVLSASGGSAGQYRWYTVASGGTAIAGAVNSAFTTSVLTTTTTFYVSINNGLCESNRTAVVANIVFCNQPPVIAAASATVPVAGSTTITLLSLISDPDNNLDLSTLSIVSSPTSGATASLVNGVLSVNYAGISFAGPDQLTIRVCDVVGACVQRVVTIDVTGDVIVYNGISPNGDNDNDKWIIQYIELIPDTRENKVSIFNRWGDEVFATDNYDNLNRVFTGVGKNGSDLSSGTYFYKIEFSSGKAPLSGYITLKR